MMPYVPALCALVYEKLHARTEQTAVGQPVQVMPGSASLALYARVASRYENSFA